MVPGGSRDRVVGLHGDTVKVQVAAPPEGGRANRATVAVVARWATLSPGRSAWSGAPGLAASDCGCVRPARAARRRARGPARLELQPSSDGRRRRPRGPRYARTTVLEAGADAQTEDERAGALGDEALAAPVGRWWLIGSAATMVIVADQITKWWARNELESPMHVIGSLRFNLAFNSGTAFSRFQGWGQVIAVLAVVVVVILLRASRTVRPPWGARPWAWCSAAPSGTSSTASPSRGDGLLVAGRSRTSSTCSGGRCSTSPTPGSPSVAWPWCCSAWSATPPTSGARRAVHRRARHRTRAMIDLTLADALDGERVDRVVAMLTGLSRAASADLVASGAVAHRRAAGDHPLGAGPGRSAPGHPVGARARRPCGRGRPCGAGDRRPRRCRRDRGRQGPRARRRSTGATASRAPRWWRGCWPASRNWTWWARSTGPASSTGSTGGRRACWSWPAAPPPTTAWSRRWPSTASTGSTGRW